MLSVQTDFEGVLLCQDSSEESQGLQRRGGLTLTQSPGEMAWWWGEWSSWSTCSRSCGGGVRSQERHCLQRRRSSANHNITSSLCTGSPKRYQLCPSQVCLSPTMSFKQQQCAQFNSRTFGRRHYEWIPLYPDDYISISNKPCDLQCTTTTAERQLLVPAHDGTVCRDARGQGVCIAGVCQTVGCDGQLYSSRTLDRCGVCGGNGTSCLRVSGSYRRAVTQLGYVLITHIPAGATDIQIIERRQTENILALCDETGRFFFNGNAVIDNPRNFLVGETVFKYRRPGNLFTEGLEYILAQGPTQIGLNAMYYNLNGKLPHITYEFTIPRQHSDDVSALRQRSDDVIALRRSETRTAAPFMSVPRPVSMATTINHTLKDLSVFEDVGHQDNGSRILEELLRVYRPASDITPDSNHVEEVHGPAAYRSFSNLIDSHSANPNSTHRPAKQRSLQRNHFLKVLLSLPGPPGHAPCPEGSSPCSRFQFNKSAEVDNRLWLEVYPGSISVPPDSTPYGLPEEAHDKQTQTLPDPGTTAQGESQAAMLLSPQQRALSTESNDFEVVSMETDVSVADMYRWKVSAYAPCSATCTTGISSSYALCVRYDGAEVDETFCDSVTRPEPTHEFCTGKECPPRWETSRWSTCSRTCGEGVQVRTVRCWRMMAPGLDSSVYEQLCESADLHRPTSRKSCRSKACGPQWELSDWSECLGRCGGRGLRRRDVRCSMETRLCNESSQPISSEACEGPPCDRHWTVSDWGPCSGVCGRGHMVRGVSCQSASGTMMSEEQCEPKLRPLAVYPCGEPDCPAHWVEQEWGQCNATCGRGMRLRQVVCAGLEGGVFKEFPEISCDPALQPERSSTCFQRPCSKWFTTSWSQCSKTCGSGVHVREVRCYQGEELGHSCDSALKPEARQMCEVQPCPTHTPAAADEPCLDKATANCSLVLRVKLCSHWYYRKACCLACTTLRP
ncbi:ADAMTS-like protein 2 [Aplochiton taeniatus]